MKQNIMDGLIFAIGFCLTISEGALFPVLNLLGIVLLASLGLKYGGTQ